MRSILAMTKVTLWSFVLVLSLACLATAETGTTKADQSVKRKGGQAGQEPHMEKRAVESGKVKERVGGQAGEETPLEERKTGYGEVKERVGGQSGLEEDLKKPGGKSK
jgi:hypothetical protein